PGRRNRGREPIEGGAQHCPGNPRKMGAALMAQLAQAADEEEALEALHRNRYTDGLPVVVPTPKRVESMVLASCLDADLVLGVTGPSQAAATVESVAINAVMAGCLPDHFPVV